MSEKRHVVIAANFMQAEHYLRVIGVHRKDALVITGATGLNNLRSLDRDTNRVVTLGHWQRGFRAEELYQVQYLLEVRNIEVTHVEEW